MSEPKLVPADLFRRYRHLMHRHELHKLVVTFTEQNGTKLVGIYELRGDSPTSDPSPSYLHINNRFRGAIDDEISEIIDQLADLAKRTMTFLDQRLKIEGDQLPRIGVHQLGTEVEPWFVEVGRMLVIAEWVELASNPDAERQLDRPWVEQANGSMPAP